VENIGPPGGGKLLPVESLVLGFSHDSKAVLSPKTQVLSRLETRFYPTGSGFYGPVLPAI